MIATSLDFRPVFRVVGLLLCGLAGAMLIPAAVDANLGNPDWQVFLSTAAVTAVFAGTLVLTTRTDRRFVLSLKQAFLMTGLCWVILPAFGAMPFLGLGLSYTDAFFESISGLTTTGSTVIAGLDTLPPGVLLWRSLLQWIGGVGIIVMAIIVLPFLRIGGMQIFYTESSERSEKVLARPLHMASWIAAVYGTLTLACAVFYGAAGMTGFDAVNHALTTLATGGYSTHDASFGYFGSAGVQWGATLFMLSGALPFAVYIRMIRGDSAAIYRDSQIRALVGFLALAAVAMAVWLSLSRGDAFLDALRLTAFNITSIVTTTGYATQNYMNWGAPVVGVFLYLIFLGGCSGSTAGGMKIYRLQILWVVLRGYLRRLFSPHQVITLSYGGRRLPEDVPASVLAFAAAYFAIVAVGTIALSGMGLDLVSALSASATATSNVGPGLGDIVGPAGNFAGLPDGAKWILAGQMLLGRLEIFTILVMLDPQFWRD